MPPQINTIQELEHYYYGGSVLQDIMKVDAPILTSTTGVLNTIFGKLVWAQLNQEANVFGLLPKDPWDKSGWRLSTARGGAAEDGGIAEGGTIPDTIKYTYVEVTNTLKTIAHAFDVSEVQSYLSTVDDAIGKLEDTRESMGILHKERMNEALLRDVSAEAAAATANYTTAVGLETIDRLISNDSEEDAFGGTYSGFFDIFGLDRDTATTFDSFVDHNSGTDRALTDAILRNLISSVGENGGNTTVFITGWDTYNDAIALYQDQVRYKNLGEAKVQFGVNGIQTEHGIDVGIRLTSIYGIPTIKSKNVAKDTVSRIYALDTSDPEGHGKPRIGLSIAKPTQYFEYGVETGQPWATDKFNTEGLYRTMGELMSPRLDAQGKVRDLL